MTPLRTFVTTCSPATGFGGGGGGGGGGVTVAVWVGVGVGVATRGIGCQSGSTALLASGDVNRVWSVPSRFIAQICPPLSQREKAIRVPSGEKAGSDSSRPVAPGNGASLPPAAV